MRIVLDACVPAGLARFLADHDVTTVTRLLGASNFDDYSELTADERIRLAAELWDSVTPDAVHLSQRQSDELARRREHLRRHGSQGRPWREVLKEIKRRGA